MEKSMSRSGEDKAAVVCQGLVKRYRGQKQAAADHISFTVNSGELFGLIGPDGAGKTTIFRMLTTLIAPDEGRGWVEGRDIVQDYAQIRKSVGYMPGRFSLYQDLSVEENLAFFATVFGTTVAANYELIRDIYVQIEPFRKRRAGQLSGGMKQKLALCCALIHQPAVLFLDEPTTGVDPVSRREFWDMLGRLKRRGITIVTATPYMDEAALCDRIALIQRGRLLSVDTPAAIAASYPYRLLAVKAAGMAALLKALDRNPHVVRAYGFGEYAHVALNKDDGYTEAELKGFLQGEGLDGPETKKVKPVVEDCFIDLLS
jgi:ABC-type multidrug transport system ATPase subunit